MIKLDNQIDLDLINTRWSWYWREEDGMAVGGITMESRPGHGGVICRCPKFYSRERWEKLADHICNLHNASLEK